MIKNIVVYMTHPHVEAWAFKPFHKAIVEAGAPGSSVTLCYSSKEFRDHLPKADAVVVWFFKREWLELAPHLKLIATPAAGRDWIEPLPEDGPAVWFGSFHGPMIAESVLGAMLYFCKAFSLSKKMQDEKKWARVKISGKLRSLYQSQVTILGFGNIGQVIGRRLKPFGCRLTGVRRTPADAPDYFGPEDRIVTLEQLPEVLKETDHLIVALPGGLGTEGLLTRELLQRMPRSSFFYNVGRGNACREADLAAVLKAGDLAGAYLDVFETEPLPAESPLWRLGNVLIQPHLSAASPEYLERFAREFVARLNGDEGPK